MDDVDVRPAVAADDGRLAALDRTWPPEFQVGLRVLGSNTGAIRLYERRGSVLEGRLRDEFRLSDGRYDDDLWYALDLTGP